MIEVDAINYKTQAYKGQMIGRLKTLREELIQAQIPDRVRPEGNKSRRKGRPPKMSEAIYRQRNINCRFFGKMKEMRRFSCRFNKMMASSCMAFAQLAPVRICMNPYFQTQPRDVFSHNTYYGKYEDC